MVSAVEESGKSMLGNPEDDQRHDDIEPVKNTFAMVERASSWNDRFAGNLMKMIWTRYTECNRPDISIKRET
jgi:hypothetical protein